MAGGERDYSKGKVYKIVCSETGKCYVGSTAMPLYKRLNKHKGSKTGAWYHFSRAGWDKATIVLVEEYPCDNVYQLREREEHWRVELKAELNRIRAHVKLPEGTPRLCDDSRVYQRVYRKVYGITDARRDTLRLRYEQNKDSINEKKREYRAQNKEKIQEERRKYHEANKDAINEAKRRRRRQNEDQRSKEREYNARYKEENKARLKEQRTQRVPCPHCQEDIAKSCLTKHIRRKHADIKKTLETV